MPRRARLRIADLPLHIIQRGNNRGACFFADDDYLFYLHHLGELSRKFRCSIHAYVLMTNHVHLLVTPGKLDSASLLMKHLGQRYVQYINRTYKRSGTLWAGRFRSSIVQLQDYLLRCYRYIELNPVRANMVQQPEDYRWSSYRNNAQGQPNLLITPHPEYLSLGSTETKRQRSYATLFDTELDPKQIDEIRTAANGGYALGDDRFREEIEIALKRRTQPGRSGRPTATKLPKDERQREIF